ncbi:Archaeal Lon protease [uncultured archaeon]|nr:Archaeal Lon protease [uncultured archaeon]
MRKATISSVIAAFIIGIIAGAAAYSYFLQTQVPLKSPIQQPPSAPPASMEGSVTLSITAIDNNGNGTVVPLTVQKREGNGETLININDIVFWFDTQQSIQTANSVAKEITGVDTSRLNLEYIMGTQSSLVEGPSAGAALTIATIAVLKDKTPNKSVMITGAINSDGSIGPVGGVLQKAKAAKAVGAQLLLVPEGESLEVSEQPVQTCTTSLSITYCQTTYKKQTVNISESAGLTVKEVSTIQDAEKYFFS